MAEKTVAAKENGGKKFDAYKNHCKLMALAILLGNAHNMGCMLEENECFGIEQILMEIAFEVCPKERPGGAE